MDSSALLFTCGSDHTIRSWRLSSDSVPPIRRSELIVPSGHVDCVRSLYFCPQTVHLFSGSDDCSIREWDVSRSRSIRCYVNSSFHTSCVVRLASGPTSFPRTFCSCGWDGNCIVFDPRERIVGLSGCCFFRHPDCRVLDFSFCESSLFSVGSDQILREWDVRRTSEEVLVSDLKKFGVGVVWKSGIASESGVSARRWPRREELSSVVSLSRDSVYCGSSLGRMFRMESSLNENGSRSLSPLPERVPGRINRLRLVATSRSLLVAANDVFIHDADAESATLHALLPRVRTSVGGLPLEDGPTPIVAAFSVARFGIELQDSERERKRSRRRGRPVVEVVGRRGIVPILAVRRDGSMSLVSWRNQRIVVSPAPVGLMFDACLVEAGLSRRTDRLFVGSKPSASVTAGTGLDEFSSLRQQLADLQRDYSDSQREISRMRRKLATLSSRLREKKAPRNMPHISPPRDRRKRNPFSSADEAAEIEDYSPHDSDDEGEKEFRRIETKKEMYEGEVVDGLYQGHGELFRKVKGFLRKTKLRRVYVGEFLRGLYDGVGTLYYPTQEILFKGEFFMGRRHGRGEEYSRTGGVKVKGEWDSGALVRIHKESTTADLRIFDVNSAGAGAELVDTGAFAMVSRVVFDGRVTAVKVLDPGTGQDGMKMFESEVKILASLKHPFIVKLLGWHPDRPAALVMEFVDLNMAKVIRSQTALREGELDDELRKMPLLTFPKIIRYTHQFAQAMNYLHEQHIIHYDLKWPNVLYDPKFDVVKVADFGGLGLASHMFAGLSMFFESYRAASMKHRTRGTLGYTAPEVMAGETGMNSQADVFSFAIMLFELMTLRMNPLSIELGSPQGRTNLERLRTDPQFRPRFPPRFRGRQLRWLRELIRDCWAADPRRRPRFAQIVNRIETSYDTSVEVNFE